MMFVHIAHHFPRHLPYTFPWMLPHPRSFAVFSIGIKTCSQAIGWADAAAYLFYLVCVYDFWLQSKLAHRNKRDLPLCLALAQSCSKSKFPHFCNMFITAAKFCQIFMTLCLSACWELCGEIGMDMMVCFLVLPRKTPLLTINISQ